MNKIIALTILALVTVGTIETSSRLFPQLTKLKTLPNSVRHSLGTPPSKKNPTGKIIEFILPDGTTVPDSKPRFTAFKEKIKAAFEREKESFSLPGAALSTLATGAMLAGADSKNFTPNSPTPDDSYHDNAVTQSMESLGGSFGDWLVEQQPHVEKFGNNIKKWIDKAKNTPAPEQRQGQIINDNNGLTTVRTSVGNPNTTDSKKGLQKKNDLPKKQLPKPELGPEFAALLLKPQPYTTTRTIYEAPKQTDDQEQTLSSRLSSTGAKFAEGGLAFALLANKFGVFDPVKRKIMPAKNSMEVVKNEKKSFGYTFEVKSGSKNTSKCSGTINPAKDTLPKIEQEARKITTEIEKILKQIQADPQNIDDKEIQMLFGGSVTTANQTTHPLTQKTISFIFGPTYDEKEIAQKIYLLYLQDMFQMLPFPTANAIKTIGDATTASYHCTLFPETFIKRNFSLPNMITGTVNLNAQSLTDDSDPANKQALKNTFIAWAKKQLTGKEYLWHIHPSITYTWDPQEDITTSSWFFSSAKSSTFILKNRSFLLGKGTCEKIQKKLIDSKIGTTLNNFYDAQDLIRTYRQEMSHQIKAIEQYLEQFTSLPKKLEQIPQIAVRLLKRLLPLVAGRQMNLVQQASIAIIKSLKQGLISINLNGNKDPFDEIRTYIKSLSDDIQAGNTIPNLNNGFQHILQVTNLTYQALEAYLQNNGATDLTGLDEIRKIAQDITTTLTANVNRPLTEINTMRAAISRETNLLHQTLAQKAITTNWMTPLKNTLQSIETELELALGNNNFSLNLIARETEKLKKAIMETSTDSITQHVMTQCGLKFYNDMHKGLSIPGSLQDLLIQLDVDNSDTEAIQTATLALLFDWYIRPIFE